MNYSFIFSCYLFILLFFWNISISQSNKNSNTLHTQTEVVQRPYHTNDSYRYEWLAIHEGREQVIEALNEFPERKHLLCSTFVNASNILSKENLAKNMRLSYFHCDWAVIIYGGPKSQICHNKEFYRFFVHCNHTHALKRYPSLYHHHRHIPKPLLYFDLLPYLPEYQYVLLMDEDISLEGFSFPIYKEIFHCAFHPMPPPLISQGLIDEESQDYLFLRPSSWNATNIISSETTFVEQQIPYFNAIFFQWFIQHVLERAVPKIIETGSTWGSDTTWCGAAFMFAKEILNYDIDTYIPCQLVIDAPHYHHLDFRTIQPKRSNWTEFWKRGDAMLEYFHSLYPAWNTYQFTQQNATIPSHPDTILKRVRELPKDCPFHEKKDYKQTHQEDIQHATHHHFSHQNNNLNNLNHQNNNNDTHPENISQENNGNESSNPTITAKHIDNNMTTHQENRHQRLHQIMDNLKNHRDHNKQIHNKNKDNPDN